MFNADVEAALPFSTCPFDSHLMFFLGVSDEAWVRIFLGVGADVRGVPGSRITPTAVGELVHPR